MTQSEQYLSDKSFSWKIDSLQEDKLVLKFDFDEPSSISNGVDAKPDVAILSFYNTLYYLSPWRSKKLTIEDGYQITVVLPTQMSE